LGPWYQLDKRRQRFPFDIYLYVRSLSIENFETSATDYCLNRLGEINHFFFFIIASTTYFRYLNS
jgi:hypothetical protein